MNKKLLIEEWLIAILLCVMVLMVVGQVVSRYLLHTSFSHTEELVRYFFVWATFLGASAAVHRKKHLSIAGALSFVPDRVMSWSRRLAGVGALFFVGVLLIYGVHIVILQIETHQTTAALGFPMWIIGLSVPVCSLFIIVRIVKIMTGRGEGE